MGIVLISFQDVVSYGLFKLNQVEIIENLCTNTKIGNTQCQGHCQLTKMLNDEQQEQEVPYTLSLSELSKNPFLFYTINPPKQAQEENFSALIDPLSLYQHYYSPWIFRPPTV